MMEFTQVWGYDDLVQFQATQQHLSSQIGCTPALSFCPTCGIFLLDTGSTQAQRDAHIQSCRDVEDPEGLDVVSEGEEGDDATDEAGSVSKSDNSDKRYKSQTGTEPQKACNQENSLDPASADARALVPAGAGLPQRPVSGILTEASSSTAATGSGQRRGDQVRDSTMFWIVSPYMLLASSLSLLVLCRLSITTSDCKMPALHIQL